MAVPIGALRAELSAGHAQFSADMKKAKNAVQINASKMSRAMHTVGDKFKRAVKAMTSFRGIMTGAAMVAGMLYAIKKNLEYADTIAKTADKIGITTEALQRYRYIADRSGVATDKLDKAFAKFSVGIGDLRAGTGTLYTILNKNNKALMGQLVAADNTTEALDIYFKALEDITNQNDRASLAAAAFGVKAGVGMTLMVDNIDTLTKRFKRLGVEIDEKLLRGAEEAKDNIDDLQVVIKTSLASALVAIAPGLGQVAADMAMWVANNKDFVTQDIPGKINDMAKSVRDFTSSTEYKLITEYWELAAGAALGFKLGIKGGVKGGIAGAVLGAGAAGWLKVYSDIRDMIGEASDEATTYEQIQKAIEDRTKEIRALQRSITPTTPVIATREYQRRIENLRLELVKLIAAKEKLEQKPVEEKAAPTVTPPSSVDDDAPINTVTTAIQKQIDALKQQRDTFGMVSNEVTLYHMKMQGATEAQLKQAEAILDTIDTMKAYAATDEAIIDMMADIDEGTKASIKSLEDLADKTEEKSNIMEQAFAGWGNSFSSTLNDMLWGSETTFEAIAESFAKMVTQMMIQKYLIEKMFGGGGGSGWFGISLKAISGIAGGGMAGPAHIGAGGTTAFGMAQGGVLERGNLLPFAKGGIVSLPTVFPMAQGAGLMGEAGPEAVMPLKRTSSGDLGVVSNNGGGTTIIINAIDSKSFAEVVKRNPGSIVTVINDALENRTGLLDTIRGTV
ncbi:MAG: phage tail tape measure protein [Deltaproteobacteria bacterium]|nr:phage tail tape measure protein [Deltaproteobacteria bacterium]